MYVLGKEVGVFELTNVESVGNLHDIYAFKYTPIITAIQNTSLSNLRAILQQCTVSIFTMLDYAKSSKRHYSALGGVVFKSGVQIEPIRYSS